MKLADFLSRAVENLRQSGVDSPQLDARLLAGHALGIDRAQLLSQSERVLDEKEIAVIGSLMARRVQRESVARIIGKREFWGLDFGLNEATLEPRPDSETLIEAVLKAGREKNRILDLGTGTGCLLLALLHEIPDATGVGIDIDTRAVAQAKDNAATLGLDERADFRAGDWLAGIAEKFDIIVSNPPYIPAGDIPALMPEVRAYDPMAALDGGADGLDPYRFLIPQLKEFLNPQGLVALEVGINQAPQVVDMLQQAGFAQVETHRDLGGIARCLTARLRDR